MANTQKERAEEQIKAAAKRTDAQEGQLSAILALTMAVLSVSDVLHDIKDILDDAFPADEKKK